MPLCLHCVEAQHRGLQVQVLAVAPAIKEGTLVTYCSGLSGFPQERLAELNQSRCAPAWH